MRKRPSSEPGWSTAEERAHFQEIWGSRRSSPEIRHTKDIWNERAHEWARELQTTARSESSARRVSAAVDYLRAHGLLAEDQDVIDIGCGPGRFAAQFAKTARHVVGTDLSDQMMKYGAEYAKELGVTNVSFVEADFQTADIDALGWRNRFDLVFSSITPAINGMTGLQKMMDISRGWCFNSCFVHFGDELEQELVRNVLKREPENLWNGHWHWFYALFNLLWLDGYYPETSYYKEERRTELSVSLAEGYAERLARDYGESERPLRDEIAAYLKRQIESGGPQTRGDDCWYGWILWDTRHRTER